MLTQTGRSETAILDAAAGRSLRLDPDDVERLAADDNAWQHASSRGRVPEYALWNISGRPVASAEPGPPASGRREGRAGRRGGHSHSVMYRFGYEGRIHEGW